MCAVWGEPSTITCMKIKPENTVRQNLEFFTLYVLPIVSLVLRIVGVSD